MSANTPQKPNPSTQTSEAVLEALGVERAPGLTEAEAHERLERYGPNRLVEFKPRSAWTILLEQFKSIIVVLLLVASAVSFAFEDILEGVAILFVILLTAAIGFFTELRAVRSMEALRKLGQVTSRVRRGGQVQEIDAEKIVPGDILLLDGGDVVTADARLLEAAKLQVNESSLTGESIPVDKHVKPVAADAPIAERSNMVFKGTSITRGSGECVVTSTGMDTELGRISALVQTAEDETTPLERRLGQLGQRLARLTIGIAALLFVLGLLNGRDLVVMIETAVALAVASIPEGLPIVATIALARGMQRMAKRNALVNRLSAVETLGATTVICTDKTGTLTENKISVGSVLLNSAVIDLDEQRHTEADPLLVDALRIGVLCNNAAINHQTENGGVGDPLELALLNAGAQVDLHREKLLAGMPEISEIAFDNDTNMMATIHQADAGYYFAVKGAPEAVIDACHTVRVSPDETEALDDVNRHRWLERNAEAGSRGLRMLAVAEKRAADAEAKPYEDLTLVALLGLHDPAREDVARSLAACQQAGIRVVMVTGDQPATARRIAEAVGMTDGSPVEAIHGSELEPPEKLTDAERRRLLDARIFARVSPEQKLNIIAVHQANGARVAMTGDGVNDAPALKKADIGIAMGQRGTQVARETADIVLKDDAFSTIVAAVREGRIIFGNIRRFVLYMLSCNISEILVVGLATLASAPLPILPLQILFLNLVTDVFPALALSVGEGDDSVMRRPPRNPNEPILLRRHWLELLGYSLLITLSVLGVFAWALFDQQLDESMATTLAFLVLAFAQLWLVFNMRDFRASPFLNDVTRNPWVWGALALCTLLLLAAVYTPLRTVLKLETLEPGMWLVVIAASLAPLVVGQIGHEIARILAARKG
ncbi:MAG: cation-transporting P-type ATPase [Anaerolineae bacterium]|nr:cation-transporting P-type ATPase [Anaerolineae bacterium]